MTVVRVEGVVKNFASSRRGEPVRAALRGVEFSVDKGEIFGLLGPNGGGKTTLFRILSTALLPTAGSAEIFGVDVAGNPSEVRRKIGVVFQNSSLDKKLTLKENLFYQGPLYGLRGENLRRRVDELFSRLGLTDRADDIVETLSGGLQRRVEIAKGMIHSPELLLMDEPSAGLDPGARRDLWAYLAELKKEGVTILVTTHLMEEAEKCDRLAIINKGEIVALGSPSELKEEIGGDVILIQSRDPEKLRDLLKNKFGGEPSLVDGAIRLERSKGHEFIPQIVEAFPGAVEAVSVGKPTLEDVFVRRTGHRFWWVEGTNGRG